MAKRKAFLLRIDPKLWDGLQAWAADELRSVNAQIEFLLRQALAKSGRLPPPGDPSGEAKSDSEGDGKAEE
ncbi:MAG: hypothetical protein DWQ01_06805 [Planctomycetota bacterium]|nr:MAG: hypothetical protein DWQ01_06805 [Planctomycetota bacterium]